MYEGPLTFYYVLHVTLGHSAEHRIVRRFDRYPLCHLGRRPHQILVLIYIGGAEVRALEGYQAGECVVPPHLLGMEFSQMEATVEGRVQSIVQLRMIQVQDLLVISCEPKPARLSCLCAVLSRCSRTEELLGLFHVIFLGPSRQEALQKKDRLVVRAAFQFRLNSLDVCWNRPLWAARRPRGAAITRSRC